MAEKIAKTGLELLREPFPANQISKLPKPTAKQTEEAKPPNFNGIRCKLCGAWHHPDVVHLDYVGHAALTYRLLDCDPQWNWEPLAYTDKGLPQLDEIGGMWIKLTVCDVTRLGYGHPDDKRGGNAIKEIIGDALRNAAMRFGAALDLWHKGDLHAGEDDGNDAVKDAPKAEAKPVPAPQAEQRDPRKIANSLLDRIAKAASGDQLSAMNEDGTTFAAAWQWLEDNHKPMAAEIKAAFDKRLARAGGGNNADLGGDAINY